MHTYKNVIILQIFLKRDAEYCVKELAAIKRAVRRELSPAMHDKRHLAFVIVTNETPNALLDRLRSVLDQDAITNYWAIVPHRNVASKYRSIDSLATRVNMAYGTIMKRSEPQHLIYVQMRGRKNFGKNAPVKVGIEAARVRQSPQKPDGPNGE